MVLHPDRGRRGRAPGVLVRAVLLGAALLSFEPLRGLWSFVSSPRPSRQHARTAAHAGARSDKRPSPIPEQVSAILQRYAKTLKVSEVKSSFQKILDSGTTLAVGQYNRALEAMAKAKRPGDAAEFLTFMEAQVQPEGAAYDHLVTSHLNAGDFEEALKTLLSSPTVLLKTCKRLLRSLLEQKKDVKSATRLMSCMPAMGLQPSYPMYKGMVAAAAEEGNLDLADRWFQQLKENGMQPESGLFVSLIKGCWKARDPERAVRYFNLMRRLPGEEATFPRGTYSWLIRSLAQAESAANLLERMRAAGLDPSLETYEAVLKAWSELQLPDMRKKLEQSWIQGLKANGTKVSRDVYKTLMRASKSDIRSMEEWMNQMQMAGHWVGVYEYNNLLQACESAIDYRSAEKWFDRMTQANVTANAVSYNLIIKTMAKAGQPKKAKQWGRRMEQAGLLSSKTLQFELVVKSLLQTSQNSADYIAGWAAKANELKKDMNASVYHNVMRAYFLENKPEEARQWVEWMETNGTSTNSETYMMLMRYDDRQTTFWHQKMDEKGVPPSTDSFNLVLRSLSEVKGKKRLPLVEEWYERMQDAGCPPNEETYALLISAAAKSGQNEAGEQWFSKMTKSGLSPDREVYQALMLRSLREGDPVAVRQILDWMVLKGIKLNRGMYNLAIRAFAEAGEAEGAEEIFRRLQAAGRDPDERSFFHLIDCHVRQRAMEKARDWLDQMLEIGVRPSFRIYAALAAGYARTGDVASTKEFLDTIKVKMYTSKITRDTWTAMMEPVLWCLEQAGEEEEVQNWLAFAEQKGFPVNVAEPMEADEDAEMNAPQQRTEGGRPRGAGDADKVKQAMNALDAMKSQGKTPTIEDFNKVMWRFASSSRSQYSQARDFLETSILPVIQPTARTFLELLRCNRRGDGRRGIYTLEWMHDQGFTITRAHVDVVARQLAEDFFNKKVQDLEGLLEKVLATLERKLQSGLYQTMILRAAEVGQLETSKEWYMLAQQSVPDFRISPRTCRKVAKAHFKGNDVVGTFWWLEQARRPRREQLGEFIDYVAQGDFSGSEQRADRRAGLVDRLAAFVTRLASEKELQKEEVPYLEVIEAYAAAKHPQGATAWLEEMVAALGDAPVEAYNTVIRSYAEAGDMEAANRWLARLQASSTEPTEASYEAVLEAYASKGDVAKAQEIWKELAAAPSNEASCSMLRTFCVAKDAEQVEAFLERLEWEGVQLNQRTYLELVRFYIHQGSLEKALILSEEMAMGEVETGSRAWVEQLQAAHERQDRGHAEKVALAMAQQKVRLNPEDAGLLREVLGDSFEASSVISSLTKRR